MQLDMIFLTIIVPLTLLGLGFLIAISICMEVVNEIEKEENKNDCITFGSCDTVIFLLSI